MTDWSAVSGEPAGPPPANGSWTTVTTGDDLRIVVDHPYPPERIVLQGFPTVDSRGVPDERAAVELVCATSGTDDGCQVAERRDQVIVTVPLEDVGRHPYVSAQATWLALDGHGRAAGEAWATWLLAPRAP